MARRIDYYDDPDAPKANSLVPSVNVVVINDDGRDPADTPLGQRQLGRPRRRDRPRRVHDPGRDPRDQRRNRNRLRDHRASSASTPTRSTSSSTPATARPGRSSRSCSRPARSEASRRRAANRARSAGFLPQISRLHHGSLHAHPCRSLPGRTGFSGSYVMVQHGSRLHLSGQEPAVTAVAD